MKSLTTKSWLDFINRIVKSILLIILNTFFTTCDKFCIFATLFQTDPIQDLLELESCPSG
jgi:hypothetical protein